MTENKIWSYGDEMAIAFTEKEREAIIRALKTEARRCAAKLGVRKTTVDQLAQAADISKGAFYSFYPSKELLFFEILEDLHTELYQVAFRTLSEHAEDTDAGRASAAVLAICRGLEDSGMMDFMERDVHYILRKIPTDVQDEHYHSDEVHIKAFLDLGGLHPEGGVELAAACVRGLLLTVSHRADIGPLYPQVLETLVTGACSKLFP